MMTVHQDQANPKSNRNHMTCRDCVQLPLDMDVVYASIDTQILKPPQNLSVHLVALYCGRKPDIGTLKKERGGIFSECCTESFKKKILIYVNEVQFLNGELSPKRYISRRNNSHRTEKWGLYMPEIYYDK